MSLVAWFFLLDEGPELPMNLGRIGHRVQDDRGRLWVESETISYPCLVRHGDHFFEAVNEIDLRILFALFKHWDRQ